MQISLRRRQRLSLEDDALNHTFVLESGCVTVDVPVGDRRHVLLVLYPGEQINRSSVPPMAQIGLTAAAPSSLIRLMPGTAGDGNHGDPAGAGALPARLAARSGLHAITIGCLNSEERLATLLAEIALFTGQPTPIGCSFDLPLSREDMADYLAINPDTLSRLMSRLRASRVLVMSSRTRATVKDLDALLAMTPLARALRLMRPDAIGPVASASLAAPA